MAIKLNEFIDRFKAMEKVANETLAADPEALVGVDSMPGSEHDKKVPADAKKPDEEVAQGQPAGATTAEGAVNGGDAKPLNEGKFEMDEPLLNPEQKPLVTDDALTAKTANARLTSLVSDLLADLNGTQKEAQCCSDSCATAKAPEKKEGDKDDAKKDDAKGEKKASKENAITLDDETIAKLAAAQVAFANGRNAAEAVMKQASAGNRSSDARALVKAACVKAAQDAGLAPAEAEAAADNAMMAAGIPPEAPVADAAADAGAADAAAAEAAAGDAKAAAEIPEDVTEEELATAIVDLVSSGELDPDTAKALVEEIAGDEGTAGPTEDQAAEIIAQGLESGEITPEQAQEIAAAVEGGDAAGAAEAAGEADAGAAGAADAAAAIQDAQDEAQGAADAEEAMKTAAAMIRKNALNKVASHIVEKRAAAKLPAKGSKVMAKVASILQEKVAQKKASANQSDESEAKYIAGFKKKAAEMGVDPSALAKYVVESQAK